MIKQRSLPERLRYLALKLRGGATKLAIAIALEAMADELEAMDTVTDPGVTA